MLFKVFSTSPTFGYYALEPLEYLKNHHCEVQLMPQGKRMNEEELIQSVGEWDGIIVGMEKITRRIIEASRKLRIIAMHGAGVDRIDIEAASERGIAVINAPGANSDAVADLAFGLFLSLARNIPHADRSVKGGEWPRLVGVLLNRKTLGIVGLGEIGKKVARRALGFDMRVLAYDIVKDEAFAQRWGVKYLSFEEVLAKSDFLSLHVPLSASTRRLIGEKELGLMKREAFLINISRGDIVDEEALEQALRARIIKGAALDVFSNEPPVGSPLLSLNNVVVTPHMGGYTYEALREIGMICARAIVDISENRQTELAVNAKALKGVVAQGSPSRVRKPPH